MSNVRSMYAREEAPKRVLLLMSPSTYRAGAFLSAAQQLQLEVVVGIDLPESLADYWHVPLGIDFSDTPTSVRTITDYAREHPITAILSVDDSASELAAQACASLGLPHNSPGAAEAARDKLLMRRLMSEGGAPCPVFRDFSLQEAPEEIAQRVSYPCVLKPRRLSGSRGVIRANNPAEFLQAFYRLKRIVLSEGYAEEETTFLVEDFIPGVEVALEGILTHGALKVLTLFDKPDPLDGPFFEETIYTTPSRLSQEVQQAIADCVSTAASSLGLRHGPVHAELRVNESGPWMLEIAGRSIGGLCSTILEFGSGMCLEELILRHAIGEEIQMLERDTHATGVMMIPIPSAGILKGVIGVEEAAAVPLITGVEITAKVHHPLVPLPEGASYLGFIFARGETPVQVEEALRQAHRCLHFEIRREIPVLSMR
ncbi:ATP-grasp domain-containing protein [Ktedonobacter robiniae]|uniref:Phosphoribosylglycinamide synthetase n=1 Tax=Ktedonobacter robiniae TaxID=2778365 RepID=A0ABQ3V5G6_9CHLR|nr:ATP-grasp domain-containing protein [Ktedonobacter robiniae]GHO60181.1 phosphoribosylglycinamide synthetase [Ktedonobacter robiniae]